MFNCARYFKTNIQMGLSVECLEMNVDFVTLALGLILKTQKMFENDTVVLLNLF